MKKWIYIKPYIYVSYSKIEPSILLYNTKNGSYVITDDLKIIELIKELHYKENLGTKLVSEEEIKNKQIEQLFQLDMLGLKRYNQKQIKPVQLMPVLHVVNDVERQKIEGTIGENVLKYLHELTIYVNSECKNDCSFCKDANKQFLNCRKFSDSKTDLNVRDLQSIADQLNYANLIKINIIGGDISIYKHLLDIPTIFEKHHTIIHYWFWYKNIKSTILMDNIELIVGFPIDLRILEDTLSLLQNKFVKYHFIIHDNLDILKAEKAIEKLSIANFKFHPYYDGNNMNFFMENVFINNEDIFSEVIPFQKIFCNQSLNSNFFGRLIVDSNGQVYSNSNSSEIGHYNDQFVHIIRKELEENTSWRILRKSSPCNHCLYQFLCPPPSNYECVIGKSNLCNIYEESK